MDNEPENPCMHASRPASPAIQLLPLRGGTAALRELKLGGALRKRRYDIS